MMEMDLKQFRGSDRIITVFGHVMKRKTVS